MTSVNERIEKIKKETIALREEVQDLKNTIVQQNELILGILTKQAGILDGSVDVAESDNTYRNRYSDFSKRFPLDSLSDLQEMENDINESNKQQIINIVEGLLSPQGLTKNITNVISQNVIMACNLDGNQNKKRLLNYPKVVDIIFLSCNKDDYTTKEFFTDLRRALKTIKNRYHKNNCRARQKQKSEEFADNPSCVLKTEEIFFD